MAVIKAMLRIGIFCCSLLLASPLLAAVLPEDRADVLYHRYDGDGSTFHGPSILVRKQYKEKVSVWGNYYVDLNSAASIDVVTQGSPFEEERVETSAGVDYLYNKTIVSASYMRSSENDYEADNFSFGVSQDFFGDLSTMTLGFSKGDDDVYQNIRDGSGADDIVGRNACGEASHKRFSLGWTQVLTKNWIVSLMSEASVDEGFLNNCYRSVRFIQSIDENGNITVGRQPEQYPGTRNSEAYSLKSMYYLPWGDALKFEGRLFNDSWGIDATNYEFKYVHALKDQWIVELRYRFYDQTQADFYRELFSFRDEFDFMASDKELSTFNNQTFGVGFTYELDQNWFNWVDRTTVNFNADYVSYDYDNFLNKKRDEFTAGEEPGFGFNATITRLFISFWY